MIHFSKRSLFRFSSFASAASLWLVLGCQGGGGKFSNSGEGIVRPLADDTVILEYKGGKVTAKDVSQFTKAQITRLQEEAVEVYEQSARRVVIQKIIETNAKAENISPQEYMAKLATPANVSEAEVDAFFESQPELKKGVKNPQTGKMEKVSREDVKGFLMNQKMRGSQQEVVEKVLADAGVKVKISLPPPPAEKIADSAKPAFIGDAKAKVVVHEFSDFECPFCEKAKGVVKQLRDAFGDKIRIEFRHYPLPNHPNARPASAASICALEQGKFWEMHDKIFENRPKLSAEGLKGFAKDLGLDVAKFDACMANPETDKVIQADIDEGNRVGVQGTPTFFVNGTKVANAFQFDKFKAQIEEQLAK